MIPASRLCHTARTTPSCGWFDYDKPAESAPSIFALSPLLLLAGTAFDAPTRAILLDGRANGVGLARKQVSAEYRAVTDERDFLWTVG